MSEDGGNVISLALDLVMAQGTKSRQLISFSWLKTGKPFLAKKNHANLISQVV